VVRWLHLSKTVVNLKLTLSRRFKIDSWTRQGNLRNGIRIPAHAATDGNLPVKRYIVARYKHRVTLGRGLPACRTGGTFTLNARPVQGVESAGIFSGTLIFRARCGACLNAVSRSLPKLFLLFRGIFCRGRVRRKLGLFTGIVLHCCWCLKYPGESCHFCVGRPVRGRIPPRTSRAN